MYLSQQRKIPLHLISRNRNRIRKPAYTIFITIVCRSDALDFTSQTYSHRCKLIRNVI